MIQLLSLQLGTSLPAITVLPVDARLFLAVIWKVILRPRLPSLAPCGGRQQDLVAECYTCQLLGPRSTPHLLNAKFWRELPSLMVACAVLQFPPQAIQGSHRLDQSRDGSRAQ